MIKGDTVALQALRLTDRALGYFLLCTRVQLVHLWKYRHFKQDAPTQHFYLLYNFLHNARSFNGGA
jgi:hypothetical protein